MTQVQTMTNPELNRKLAELMGWTLKELPLGANGRMLYRLISPTGEGKWAHYSVAEAFNYASDYCTDPAASLEVQAAAIAKDGIQYLHNLSDVVEPDEPGYEQGGELIAYTLEHTVKLLTATPRERAEAAYITLSSKQ